MSSSVDQILYILDNLNFSPEKLTELVQIFEDVLEGMQTAEMPSEDIKIWMEFTEYMTIIIKLLKEIQQIKCQEFNYEN